MAGKKKSEEQVVRIAPLGELRAYTISEHELEKLEQGAPVSDLLTIGFCLLSIAATVLVALLTTPMPDLTLTLFFCALLIVGICGAICTFIHRVARWRGRVSTKELTRLIRARMPAAPSVQQNSLSAADCSTFADLGSARFAAGFALTRRTNDGQPQE